MATEPAPVVRATTHADVGSVVDLMAAVAAEGRWIGRELPLDREQRVVDLHESIDGEDCCSLVAVRPGEVVGSLGISHDVMGHGDLGMLVAADVRGLGVGSALLADALSWARAHPDLHKVCLQHWPHNTAAHALYRRHGFVVEGYLHRHWRRRNGDLWDAVVMGLPVGD